MGQKTGQNPQGQRSGLLGARGSMGTRMGPEGTVALSPPREPFCASFRKPWDRRKI